MNAPCSQNDDAQARVRALLAEAAKDYAATEEPRRHAQANAAADEQANARADAADNGGTW